MLLLGLSCLLLHVFVVFGTELTFELPDNDKQCFYEELEKDVKFDMDFQVSYSLKLQLPFHSECLQFIPAACDLLFERFVSLVFVGLFLHIITKCKISFLVRITVCNALINYFNITITFF